MRSEGNRAFMSLEAMSPAGTLSMRSEGNRAFMSLESTKNFERFFLFLVDSRDMKARLDEFAQSIDCVFMISIDSLHQGVSAAMAICYGKTKLNNVNVPHTR